MKSELLPFVLLCAACAAGESDGEEVARRDSAGVVILEHAEAEPRSTWRLADGPFLRIESNEADTAELLYRVAGAVAMRDGIAVANGGARQVWLYDGEARLRWRAGRAGEGPGEFQDVAALFGIAGDSLLAYDTRLRRFQVLAPGGALTRTFQLDGPSSSGPPRGAFPIGVVAARLLIVQTVRPPATVAAGTRSVRGALDILRYDLSGQFVDTLTTVPSWESYNSAVDRGTTVLTNIPVPYGKNPQIAVGGDRVVISAGENEVRVFDAERRLVHFLRNVAPPGPPVTDADIAAFRERALQSAPASMQAQLAAVYAEIPFPKTKPPIRDVFVASDGSVWVMHWPSAAGAAVPVRIYAADGTRMASIQLPSALQLQDVRSDSVLALWSDSLGVESIHMYQLIRRQN